MNGTDRILAAAAAHSIETVELLTYECYMGNCEGHEDIECPPEKVDVCSACFALAQEITDEYVPNEVLAKNCPVCVAVTLAQVTS